MEDLALSDNPFEPRRLSGADPRFLGNLATKALRVDICEALKPFYFDQFPVAAALEKQWCENLELKGYEPDTSRPYDSFAAIIRGRSGSGKTTLASSFLRHLRRCRAEGDSEWKPIEFTFRDVDVSTEPLTRPEVEEGCKYLRDELSKVAPQNWASVFVDNVSLDALGKVLDVFAEAKCIRVFVIVGDDIKLLRDDLSGFPVPLEGPYELDALDPDAAVAYARFRIAMFRHPNHKDSDLCDSMFPLLEPAVRRWSAPSSGAAGNSPNLLLARVLNTMLTSRIRALWLRFRKEDVRKLPPPRKITLAMLEQLLEEIETWI